ncbi:helix-turn-helix domain-containing protein [Aliikangiella sp. IMCC44359]|uniref:helix-turn-helix domain-containing protein n=1 Tax=Aliikangiella sp. IMCC44359 TaxID=3459125 RepID=UPI00403A857E
MNKVIKIEFEVVIQRLKEKLSEKSDRALARALGMSDSGIAVARTTKSLPIIPIVNACVAQGISLDEIFLGQTTNPDSAQTFHTLTQTDLIQASEMVDRVLDRVLTNNSLPTLQQFDAYKRLRPVLIKAVFDNDFDESIVTAIAEATLALV